MTKAKHPIVKKVSQHQQVVIINAILTLSDNLTSGKQHSDQPFQFCGYDDGGLKRFLYGTCYTPRDNISIRTMECLCNLRLARMQEDIGTIQLTVKALDYFVANHKKFSWQWPPLHGKIHDVVDSQQENMRFLLTKWDKEECGGLTPALLFLEAEGWTTELSSFLNLHSPFQALLPPFISRHKKVKGLEVAVWREDKTRTHPAHKVIHLLRYYGEPITIIAQQKSNVYREYILDKELFYRAMIAFMETVHDSEKDMGLDDSLEEHILFPKPDGYDAFNTRSYTWNDMNSLKKGKSDG